MASGVAARSLWVAFANGDKENTALKDLETAQRIARLDEVVQDKDEQLVALNTLLCDTIADRDAAIREVQAMRQLDAVNSSLRRENSQLMAQLQNCEQVIEQLSLRVRSFETKDEGTPSVASSFGGRSLYAPSSRSARPSGSGSVAGSLVGASSQHHLAPSERARMRDHATRMMLLN
ncbi:hypothetical protein T492DRAFT_1018680 [Pavlovales sp. CCMP2436]|nr:hypothetical protein T492DRAFT_1018680 [Pavlovales sp. CCMP2436]|mmetsp:Transcript_44376/g.109927  ORF Transcript_44376/g.109927 Transcript_44376/m.109927 type:complete len:177 (-) Transcript_44376:394-924(-)